MQAQSVVLDTNGFINFGLWSMLTRGERQNSYRPMLTILCGPQPTHGASCDVKDLYSSLPVEIRKSQPHASKGKKLNCPSTVESLLLPFQNPQILRTLSSEHDVIHTSAPCPV